MEADVIPNEEGSSDDVSDENQDADDDGAEPTTFSLRIGGTKQKVAEFF